MLSGCDLPPLVLASRSPRRANLLRQAGYAFTTCHPPFEDPADPSVSSSATSLTDPMEQATALAKQKARSCLKINTLKRGRSLLIAADTIVVDATGQRLGQPASQEEAAAMLARLIGAEHHVVTGVCLLETNDGGVAQEESWAEMTRVHLGPVPENQRQAYLTSGQWAGKAGGYNLAELENDWPFEIEGDPTTVVGLPMKRLQQALTHWPGHKTAIHAARAPHSTSVCATGVLGVMSGHATGITAQLTRAAMSALTPGYRAVVQGRNATFDLNLRRPRQLPRPTISVGNLTTGGTGKTPVTLTLARWLIDAGHAPAILLRGYRGTREGGSDEAAELTTALGDACVVVANPDRYAGATEALRRSEQGGRRVSTFLLDDGFQHRQVARDLDLVLIDATRPWGFGHLLPRGLLREPATNLARADAVIITRADQVNAAALDEIDTRVEHLTGRPPIAHTTHAWAGYLTNNHEPLGTDALGDRTVMGVCGIANPTAFETSLRAHAKHVTRLYAFKDHHPYNDADVQAICAEACRTGAELLVMTEKDHVKWRQVAPATIPIPVWRPRLAIRWLDGQEALGTLMDQHVGRP